MAQAAPSIFNQKATEKLRSPDDLDKYVRVANPGVWMVLVACIVLLLGLLMWGIFGSVATSVSTTGTAINGQAMCLLDVENAAKVTVGDRAYVGGERMAVESISPVPRSRDEIRKIVSSDYLVSTLMDSDWAYVVTFDGGEDLASGVPLTVSITVERIAPISLLFGERA